MNDEFVNKEIRTLQNSFKNFTKYDLNKIFSYRDIPLWEYVESTFKEIFYEPYIPTYLRLVKSLEEFFTKTKPKLVIQVYETGPYAKAFEVVAKKFKVRTIGLQHGMWGIVPPEYLHKSIQNKENPLGNPIPDRTFVFGEYERNILTNIGYYPSDNVMVAGNPTVSNVEKIKKILNKKKILSKLNIPEKKIVFVPLTYRLHYARNNNSELLLLNLLYEKFKNDHEKIFLIRPHPGDLFDQKKLNEMCPSKNFVCSKSSIFEDIFISDVVVLTYSTVGLESSLFDKPVLYVSIWGKELENNTGIYSKMFENDIAFLVSPDELFQKINFFCKNNEFRFSNPEKRKYFFRYFLNYGEKINYYNLILNK